MAEAVAQDLPKPDYGIDAPVTVKRMFLRGGWTLAFALVLFLINHNEYPGPSEQILAVLGAIALAFIATGGFMLWSSRVAKLKLRDELIDSLALTGEEKILDVGCGRGLLLIAAAKRLKGGKATGIDLWTDDLSGNSADAVKANAKIEGVSDRVRIETGDARKLVYPAANYDVVMSSLAIHNIEDQEERRQAIRELYRVLKPGGKLLIFDLFFGRDYARVLRECGAQDVEISGMKWLWLAPSRVLSARK